MMNTCIRKLDLFIPGTVFAAAFEPFAIPTQVSRQSRVSDIWFRHRRP